MLLRAKPKPCLPAGRNLLIFISSVIFLSGCASEFNTATNRQETLMYGADKEDSIGAAVALDIEKHFKFDERVDMNLRAQKILDKIAAVCDKKDVVYTVQIIDEDDLNAFSLPGGYIYVNRGLMEKVDNDDQIAAVISHEVGHVTARHALKRLQGAYGATALEVASIFSGNGALASGVSLAANSVFFKNSREDEFEADKLGIKYMRKAGYDPLAMKPMLEKLLADENKKGPRPLTYWRTHPYIPERMAQADALAKGHVEYKAYLNITGEQ